MKCSTFVLASLAATAFAQPRHGHQARHHKRDEAVVWVTEYDYVYTTEGITTTIWVPQGFVADSTIDAAPVSTDDPSALQFYEPAANTVVQMAPASAAATTQAPEAAASSTESPVAAAPSTPQADPSPEVAATAAAPSSVAPVVVPENTPAPTTLVPVVSSAAAASPAASTSPSSSDGSSSGGQCSASSPCVGDITYYQAGLGACGTTNDGDTEQVVALPHAFMGDQSNGNPYCGKMISITCAKTGKTTTAKVVDKCMGCDGFSIDLSDAAFAALDPNYQTDGRLSGNSWYFV